MPRPALVLAIAATSQNLALGITFGAYGLLIADLAAEFGAGRSQLALGIALISLVMGLSSPVLGMLLDRWSIRGIMLLGILTTATGFLLAASATSVSGFLVSYGLVVGAGVTAFGVLPAGKLAANWFPHATGRALGIVSLPILLAAGPPLFGLVLELSGWRALLRSFAVVCLCFAPVLLLLRDHPPGAEEPALRTARVGEPGWREALTDSRFWLLVLLGGAMFSGGIVLVTHVVQHALNLGISLPRASLLLSVNGVAGIAGAFLFGWLADYLRPSGAIAINFLLQAAAWPLLIVQDGMLGLVLAVAVLGLCGGGAHPALSALVGRVFGARRFGTLMGLLTLLLIPFTFGAAPIAGLLYDRAGDYGSAFMLVAGLALTGLLLVALLGARLQASPVVGQDSLSNRQN
jgi:predicted MFS family arabinose efflux permease